MTNIILGSVFLLLKSRKNGLGLAKVVLLEHGNCFKKDLMVCFGTEKFLINRELLCFFSYLRE